MVGQRVEQMAVGGERQVKRIAGERAQTRQLLDQLSQPAAQQRLAAGEADLLDSQADKELDEAEVFVDAQFGILRAHFACAAVNALVVAAVGDGDAEIVDDAPVAIGQPWGGQHRGEGDWGSGGHRHLQGYTVLPAACMALRVMAYLQIVRFSRYAACLCAGRGR